MASALESQTPTRARVLQSGFEVAGRWGHSSHPSHSTSHSMHSIRALVRRQGREAPTEEPRKLSDCEGESDVNALAITIGTRTTPLPGLPPAATALHEALQV